jgi:hypothetical protein
MIKTITQSLQNVVEWAKALKRGEKRIATNAARGRVYEKKGTENQGKTPFKNTMSGTLKIKAKITRADGSIEEFEV